MCDAWFVWSSTITSYFVSIFNFQTKLKWFNMLFIEIYYKIPSFAIVTWPGFRSGWRTKDLAVLLPDVHLLKGLRTFSLKNYLKLSLSVPARTTKVVWGTITVHLYAFALVLLHCSKLTKPNSTILQELWFVVPELAWKKFQGEFQQKHRNCTWISIKLNEFILIGSNT